MAQAHSDYGYYGLFSVTPLTGDQNLFGCQVIKVALVAVIMRVTFSTFWGCPAAMYVVKEELGLDISHSYHEGTVYDLPVPADGTTKK